jgi:penicillin amidase
MKTVKKISCNVITAILIVGGVLYGFYLKPKYEGEVQLKSIQDQTTVYFDGVPHIYANNSIDAMTALGYVHAQDRLWQMELMRRIAPGRLSEISGK